MTHKWEGTPTVLLTTDVTKKQQCHSKELQTQDTEVDTGVSMTQPIATVRDLSVDHLPSRRKFTWGTMSLS